MSIRHGLLALLERGPSHGYQLRAEFDAATGATWPLNVGQVYSTLDRLERDGLVAAEGEPDAEGRIAYRLTEDGRRELHTWFASPVSSRSGRDELSIKLALAVTTPGVDVTAVVQTQRSATMTSLQEYTRLKTRADGDAGELAWSLVLDALVFRAEAEIRWLDHCEARVARAAARRRQAGTPSSAPAADTPSATGGRR
ncbi:PadR family transcriptional regulator [Geodermatophilus sp. DF01-2]|uniref:PadR family transcriptional regulator n=1 Tax=Geodermatophilus sp. DF01-2 TaxID=2559610 RepID=UPI001073ECAF|nr:PadR family transcriptional regulator [Geodermatophilus sp. DF01_2]TFV55287.1 PadR family transcriptional regulator [Geodermatophilus sp. DF01_2]